MNSVMGNVQGNFIDTQKIREEREKELMIQREKISVNVRKLIREKTDLLNINHNLYKNNLENLNKNNINMREINCNSRNNNLSYTHNYIHNSLDNILNNLDSPIHSISPISITNIENDSSSTLNSLPNFGNTKHDNKKLLQNINESENSKHNNILNIWTFPKKKSQSSNNSTIVNSINEINDNDDDNMNQKINNSTIKLQKKNNDFNHLKYKNIKLKNLNYFNNDESSDNAFNSDDDSDIDIKIESSSYPNKKRIYIKPYICEKHYRNYYDLYSFNRQRNKNRNNELDESLFNGNPCIPESLKLRLEHEKSNDSFNKIYFNNPNDIFKKNSALIDAVEAEKKINKNIENSLINSNEPLLETENDEVLDDNKITSSVNDQNEKYRKTFDKEKFKKANNRYF